MAEAAPLAPARAALVELGAALATRSPEKVEQALRAAALAAPAPEVEEVILQSHLFVGFPDALEAMVRWRAISGAEAPGAPAADEGGWAARGERVCSRVYGDNYGKLRCNVRALHPELDRWMLEGGYGRVIGRRELDLATRELCIAALLAVWRAPRQLHSHLRGALNAGASPAEVEQAISAASRHLDSAGRAEVEQIWGRVARPAATQAMETKDVPGSRDH